MRGPGQLHLPAAGGGQPGFEARARVSLGLVPVVHVAAPYEQALGDAGDPAAKQFGLFVVHHDAGQRPDGNGARAGGGRRREGVFQHLAR